MMGIVDPHSANQMGYVRLPFSLFAMSQNRGIGDRESDDAIRAARVITFEPATSGSTTSKASKAQEVRSLAILLLASLVSALVGHALGNRCQAKPSCPPQWAGRVCESLSVAPATQKELTRPPL